MELETEDQLLENQLQETEADKWRLIEKIAQEEGMNRDENEEEKAKSVCIKQLKCSV